MDILERAKREAPLYLSEIYSEDEPEKVWWGIFGSDESRLTPLDQFPTKPEAETGLQALLVSLSLQGSK